MKPQITPEQFKATIERTKLNANWSAECKAYVSKAERQHRQHNVSALAASIERGKDLVA